MDLQHVQALARGLRDGHSRRSLARLVSGLALGGPLAALGIGEVAAKPHKKHHKRKKQRRRTTSPGVTCAAGQKPCNGACVPSTQCCTNADCGGGTLCQNGSCLCPPGRPACNQATGPTCCTPPPGMTVDLLVCGAVGGVPTCFCNFPAVGNCAADCTAVCSFRTECATPPSRETLCSSCGCRA